MGNKNSNHFEYQLMEPGILIAAIALTNFSEFLHSEAWRRPAFAVLLFFSLILRSWRTVGCTLVFFLAYAYSKYTPTVMHGLPILPFLIPFLLSVIFLAPFSKGRQTFEWMRKGHVDFTSKLLILATSLGSCAALILWAYWTDNLGYGAQIVGGMGRPPKWILFLFILPIFSLLNAFAEEVVYRGIVQESLALVFRNQAIVIILQALAFAAVHYGAGFPNGILGYWMVFVYAIVLGVLRVRTKGILAPYIAHVIADFVIACLLVGLVK